MGVAALRGSQKEGAGTWCKFVAGGGCGGVGLEGRLPAEFCKAGNKKQHSLKKVTE